VATKKELKTILTLEGEKAYSQGMQRIQSALGNVATEHALLNSQYEKGDKSLSKLTRQQDILRRKLDEQRKKVELINKAYQESAKRGEETAAITQSLASDLNMASAAMNRTQRELDALGRELEHVNSRTYQFAESMKSIGVNAQSVGSMMQSVGDKVSKVSLAIAGAVTATSVKGWMTLEDEMANVATIADTSEKSLSDLTAEAIEASNVTGVAAAEIAKAQYQAISANVATAESTGLVANAAKAAKAGVSDVTTVIDGATSIINGWGIAIGESEAVFDKLLKTQQRGKTTIGELASSIGQVTGLAPQLNMSLDETLAAVGALTQNGVATSTAMNGLKAVMSSILKPTAEAKEEAERLGLQFDSAALKAKGFTAFLADVVEKTGGSEDSLAKLFGSVEGLSQIMLLGGSAAGMYADILDDLGSSAGTLNTMFEERTASSAQRFSMALNKINNAAISLGESLAPMINVAADSIEKFADALQGMSAEEAQSVIKTALWIAGISKGISVLGSLVKHASTAKTAIRAIGTLLSPGGAVIGGIALAGTAIAGLSALTKRFSAEAVLDISVDDSELENYRVDTHALEDPVAIVAKAKLEIDRNLSDYSTDVTGWLSDGERETKEELNSYVNRLNSIIEKAYTSVSEFQTQKKEELDAQLAAGLITPEEYSASLETLQGQAAEMEGELTTAAEAVISYVTTLVEGNKKITDDEISQLNSLLEALNSTSSAVLDATNTAKQAYEWAYQKTATGIGDEADRAKAVEYVELQYQTNLSSLQSAENAVKGKYAELAVGATEAEIMALAEQEQTELATIQEQIAALEDQRKQMYAELLAGELKQAGVDMATLEDAAANMYATELHEALPATERVFSPYKDLIAETQEAADTINNTDLSGAKDIISYMVSNGALAQEAVDTTSEALIEMADILRKSEELEDVPDEFSKVGSSAVSGLDSALRSGYTPLRNTMHEMAGLISTELNGILSDMYARLDGVKSSYRSASSSRVSSGNNAAVASTSNSTIINNHINYTAGAGTRREARMLNQRLAQEQQAALISEGL